MCGSCDDKNAQVLAEPELMDELRGILKDLDELEASYTMTYLEDAGIDIPKPSEVDNDPIKGVLLAAETYPFQVAIAAREGVLAAGDFKRSLSAIFG